MIRLSGQRVEQQPISTRDFMSGRITRESRRVFRRPGYWLLTCLVAVFTVILLGIDPDQAAATRHISLDLSRQIQPPATREAPVEKADDAANEEPAAGTDPDLRGEAAAQDLPGKWHDITVKPGNSIASLFSKLDLPPQQLHKIVSQGGAAKNLEKIYPGQRLRFRTDEDLGLISLEYPIDEFSTLMVTRADEDFEISTVHRTPERRIANASGTINSSLFIAAQKAGLPDSLTMELANIFGWDIDFALDIREGDQFTILYEELYLDGEKVDNGNILAAEFINSGKTFQAIRYTDQGGNTDFYSPEGKSMRKQFLRTPVEFSRISSRFSLGRKHPILNRIRAHKGVDYAAATGTPIRVTANGKITYRGKKGGYGNTIIVQHGTLYSTLYAHMSRYKGGLHKGSRVSQGQIIGYVGSSGLATGPHLHYEFRINGVHRDPLRVKLPGSPPLDEKYMADFKVKAGSLIAKLDRVRNVQMASN